MRTAVLRGFRPTTLTHRRQPLGKWDDLDFLLLEAFQTLEDETSKSTGLPIWLTRSGHPTVVFEIHEGVDVADAAIAEWDKAQKGPKGDKEPPAGQYRYVVPTSLDTSAVPEGGLAREQLLLLLAAGQATGQSAVLPGSDIHVDRKRPQGGYDISQYG